MQTSKADGRKERLSSFFLFYSRTNVKSLPEKNTLSHKEREKLQSDLSRMSEINGILAERNQALNEENTQLREAIQKLELFQKASDIPTKGPRDIIISANKFGELFIVLRNNMKGGGTDAIVCRVSEDGSEVVAMMPRKKPRD